MIGFTLTEKKYFCARLKYFFYMYHSEIKLRVRYAETDRMGYVYYGNYATYFEVARVEALRELGMSYRELEDSGIMLPVLSYNIKYFKPAFYDEELTIRTVITEMPAARIHFTFETFNQKNEQINSAGATLVFVNVKTGRPCQAPESFLSLMKKYFVA